MMLQMSLLNKVNSTIVESLSGQFCCCGGPCWCGITFFCLQVKCTKQGSASNCGFIHGWNNDDMDDPTTTQQAMGVKNVMGV